MYEQAEPVRSPVSGPGSGRTTGPPPQSPTVHLSASRGRARYGKGATDKQEEDQETSDTYEEAEAVKRHATYTSADHIHKGAARSYLCSFIRSHRICLAAVTLVTLVAMVLFILFFINNKEISKLTVAVNDLKHDLENMSQSDVNNEQNKTTATESILGMSKMPASLSPQSVLEQLQADMQQMQAELRAKEAEIKKLLAKDQEMEAEMQQLENEMTAKDQMRKTDIQQLQAKMVAKDQRIQDLEQRDYIARCESGVLKTPQNVFTSESRDRHLDLTATFSRDFRTTPVVTVGFSLLDSLPDRNLRVNANVKSVYATHMIVQIGTWSDSKIYSVMVHWMACA
uniref:H-type lectin domain-containing protein n=1 Tax=Branchiostoma floridae TaxID=7739 RepID=C3XSZ7_BRAFL|eukprot:XP_002612856.1 hypothetical protein BRAFLDRAFT_67194 [Branchiostoma floridae]